MKGRTWAVRERCLRYRSGLRWRGEGIGRCREDERFFLVWVDVSVGFLLSGAKERRLICSDDDLRHYLEERAEIWHVLIGKCSGVCDSEGYLRLVFVENKRAGQQSAERGSCKGRLYIEDGEFALETVSAGAVLLQDIGFARHRSRVVSGLRVYVQQQSFWNRNEKTRAERTRGLWSADERRMTAEKTHGIREEETSSVWEVLSIVFHPIVGAHCKDFLFEFDFSMMMPFFALIRNYRFIPFARHFSIAKHCQRQWLPFEEARAWARQSGIGTVKEWRACRSRPPGIPSNPDIVYPDEYKNSYDWLGTDDQRRRRSTAFVKEFAEIPREVRCDKFVKQEKGINAFIELATTHAADFEFLFMPKHATVDVMFRPRSSTLDDYAALHIRASAYLIPRDGRVAFHRMQCAQSSACAVFGIDLLHNNFYFFPNDILTGTVALVAPSGIRSKWDNHRLNSFDDLHTLLTRAFETSPRQTVVDWRTNSLLLARDRSLAEMVQDLDRSLYQPCGAELTYPGGLAVAHNTELFGNLKVIHRTAYKRGYGFSEGRYESNTTKLVGRTQVPYDASDDVDLFVFGVPAADGALIGCFFFPMDVLASRSYISVGHEGGLTAISLFPPFVEFSKREDGRSKNNRAKQAWQSEFYVDLSKPDEELRESQQKFLRTLQRAGLCEDNACRA